MGQPYELSGDPDASTVEKINDMLHELYTQNDNGHALLSGRHTDTEAGTVVRGDVITGQVATGSTAIVWKRLAIGAGNRLLRSDGVDVSWAQVVLTLDVVGVLPAVNGGTGQSVYAVGDLLYANTTTTLAKLADVATGKALISGGVGVAPSWGSIDLTAHVTGILPVANGGTGRASHTAYGVICGGTTTTAAQQSIAGVGTSGQVLTSNGPGALPTFQAASGGSGVGSAWSVLSNGDATSPAVMFDSFGDVVMTETLR